MLKLVLLVENTARGTHVLGEHGLAWWLDTGSHRVLFDTGFGRTLRANAEALGVDLGTTDAIVLSHGHNDHVGGLPAALEAAPGAVIHMHPGATVQRYTFKSQDDPKGRPLSTSYMEREGFDDGHRRIVRSKEPHEVVPGLWVTGEVPRETSYEDTGGRFYLDIDMQQVDPILDDQSMFFDTPDGIVVVLGCAHAGAVNTVRHIMRFTGRSVHTLMGGMHLVNAGPERLAATVAAFRELGIQRFAPNHCTGLPAIAHLWESFHGQCIPLPVGARLEFEMQVTGDK